MQPTDAVFYVKQRAHSLAISTTSIEGFGAELVGGIGWSN